MATDGPIDTLVLQEFRLHAADTAATAARIVAALSGGIEPAVPLLVSIDDRRDVATVRAVHAGETADGDPRQRAALDPLVASWQPPKWYGPRITERAADPPSHYRLAVTESGINAPAADPPTTVQDSAEDGASTPVALLWTGTPLGTYSGLLILLGDDDDRPTARPDPRGWPRPLSDSLGVRIYDSRV